MWRAAVLFKTFMVRWYAADVEERTKAASKVDPSTFYVRTDVGFCFYFKRQE